MKLRKLFLVLAAVAVIGLCFAALTSCTKKPVASSGSGAVREITYWDMIWGPADTYPVADQALIARFNAENTDNIHVTLQNVPWDNWYQVFLTAIASGTAPDVTASGFPLPIQVADMGEGLILDSIVDQWKAENSIVLRDHNENILNLHMYDGHHYGLPWGLDSRQLLYRTDLFEQAGITKIPETWAEFLDVCAKLKASLPADVVPFVFPGSGDYNGVQSLLTFFVQNDDGFNHCDTPNYFISSICPEISGSGYVGGSGEGLKSFSRLFRA